MRTTPRLLASPSRRATRALSRALALAVGLVVWALSAHAWAAIVVAIDSPTSGKGVNGSFILDVSTSSAPAQTTTVTATINGDVRPMNGIGGRFRLNVPLAAIPYGPVSVVVTATNAGGEVAAASATYYHDVLPVVTITQPMDGTLGRPTVHVEASCSSTGLYPCVKIRLAGAADDGVLRTTLSTDVSPPSNAESRICVLAESSVGLTATTCRDRFWGAATGARMIEERYFDGPVEDIDATRVLYSVRVACGATTCMEGRIYDRATGAVTVLPGKDYRRLTSLGAIGLSGEWRAGAFLPMTVYGEKVWAGGSTIMWAEPTVANPTLATMHFRDLATGVEGTQPVTSASVIGAVGETGVAVFTHAETLPKPFYTVTGGRLTELVRGGYVHHEVQADGVQVATLWKLISVNLYGGIATYDNAPPRSGNGCASGELGRNNRLPTFALQGGNVLVAGTKGETRAYICHGTPRTRSLVVDGMLTRAEGLDSSLRAMVVRLAGEESTYGLTRYEARPGAGPMTAAPLVSLGSPTGKLRLLGSTWYAIAGRMLYRIDDGPTAPGGDAGAPGDAGIGDAGATDAGIGDAAVTDASSSLDASDDAATDGSTPSDASSATDAALADGGATSTPDAATASDASIASDAGTGSGDAGGGTPEEPAGCSQAGGAGSLAPSALVLVGLAVYRRRKRGAR